MPEFFKEYLAGGLSNALTSAILNPMDVAKTKMQNSPKTSTFSTGLLRKTLYELYNEGGIIKMYKPGLLPSMIREMINSGTRSGFYIPVRNNLMNVANSKDDNNLFIKVISAIITGTIGAVLSNPIDVVKVRSMINPVSTIEMISLILNNEGLKGFYKGLSVSCLRAGSIAVGELSCYDFTKHYFKQKYDLKEDFLLHTMCSLITGISAATAAAPFDVIKTRAMNSEKSTSSLEILRQLLKHEGIKGLAAGWLPSYLRLAPHALICFPLFEKMRSVFGLENI